MTGRDRREWIARLRPVAFTLALHLVVATAIAAMWRPQAPAQLPVAVSIVIAEDETDPIPEPPPEPEPEPEPDPPVETPPPPEIMGPLPETDQDTAPSASAQTEPAPENPQNEDNAPVGGGGVVSIGPPPPESASEDGEFSIETGKALAGIICSRTSPTKPDECRNVENLPPGAGWAQPSFTELVMSEELIDPGVARFIPPGRRMPDKRPDALACASDTDQGRGAIVEGGFYFLNPSESGNQMIQAAPDPTWCD